ncbi:MAG TPA: APC family permease [Gemmatimonadales bacterium]|nr:APC family permease [Gemmatimonadales bacterium]
MSVPLPDTADPSVLPLVPAAPGGRGKLLQVLGVSFGIAVLIGNTIIVGILRTPGNVATLLPSAGLFLGVWVLGGLYALLGALSVAEPGAMLAASGGQYVVVRRGLGEYPGFVVGWSDWISTAGPIALGAMVFTEYLEPLVPAIAGHRVPAGVALILLFGLLLWRGIRVGDLSQQVLSAVKAVAFGGLIGVCLMVPVPVHPPAAATLPSGLGLMSAVVLALQAVIYTYDGWTGPLYFGEEVRHPGRGIPRAMILGVLLVILIYTLLNLGFVRVLGVGRMAGDPFVAASAGHAIFGARGDVVIRLLVLISILSGMNACVLMAPRVLLAMSRDRLMPAACATVNPGGTPVVAHWTSIGVAAGLIVSGTFDTVLALCAFFFVANYALSFLSVFALRRKEPDTPRPYRVPGYPFTPGLALAGSLAFLAGSVVSDWSNSWKSILLLALSYPVYRWVVIGRARLDRPG